MWIESGAETYMRCRVRTYAEMGFIPRGDDPWGYFASIRQWWGERFIKEYNQAPYIKARNTPCRSLPSQT